MSALTADALYGFDPSQPRPTASAQPDHVGQPEPSVARDRGTTPADVRRPVLALVVLFAAVVLLTQFTFRGTVEVGG